jgi:hypothetical protein
VDPTPLTTASRTVAEVAEREEEVDAPVEARCERWPHWRCSEEMCGGLDGTDGLDRPNHMLMVPVYGL